MSNNNTGANGYTLIEVVITMFITATVFVGVYALFAKAMKYDAEGRYEIIASELAQEGIEMIKNKKEKNEMDWAVWKPTDGDVSNLSTFSGIDSLNKCNPSLTWDSSYDFSCGTSHKTIRYNKDSDIKQYKSNCVGSDCVGPEYTRECTATSVVDGLRVTCEVSWTSGVLNSSIATENKRTVKASLVLTDWER